MGCSSPHTRGVTLSSVFPWNYVPVVEHRLGQLSLGLKRGTGDPGVRDPSGSTRLGGNGESGVQGVGWRFDYTPTGSSSEASCGTDGHTSGVPCSGSSVLVRGCRDSSRSFSCRVSPVPPRPRTGSPYTSFLVPPPDPVSAPLCPSPIPSCVGSSPPPHPTPTLRGRGTPGTCKGRDPGVHWEVPVPSSLGREKGSVTLSMMTTHETQVWTLVSKTGGTGVQVLPVVGSGSVPSLDVHPRPHDQG